MEFTARWGWQLKLSTGIGCAALAVPAAVQLSRGLPIGYLLLALWLAALPMIIRGYSVTPTHLIIHRLGWTSRWPLSEPLEVRIEPGAMARSWRTFGNGGLFAIHGRFRSGRLGVYRAFVTDPSRTVVLRNTHGTLVVSPDDQERFVTAIRSRGSAVSPVTSR